MAPRGAPGGNELGLIAAQRRIETEARQDPDALIGDHSRPDGEGAHEGQSINAELRPKAIRQNGQRGRRHDQGDDHDSEDLRKRRPPASPKAQTMAPAASPP